MKESDVEEASVKLLGEVCPGAVIYKHADRWTAGIPDRSVTWRRYDSWLEYKLWEPNGTFHDEFALKTGRPNVQLLELLKLERQTGRAWVVAYRKGNPRTSQLECLELYRPGAWVDTFGFVLKTPLPLTKPTSLENVAWALRVNGYAMFQGHDHRAVASLIHLTHRSEYEPR